jgi:hypothetical protein
MRKHGIELRFTAKGATAEEIDRAEAAVWAVFESAGVNPWAAATAAFKLEGELEFGLNPVTDDELELAKLWHSADYQAGLAYYGAESSNIAPWGTYDLELVR